MFARIRGDDEASLLGAISSPLGEAETAFIVAMSVGGTPNCWRASLPGACSERCGTSAVCGGTAAMSWSARRIAHDGGADHAGKRSRAARVKVAGTSAR